MRENPVADFQQLFHRCTAEDRSARKGSGEENALFELTAVQLRYM
jgi:hypothetical protein